jgi:membrane-associated phospholipid phosphatase
VQTSLQWRRVWLVVYSLVLLTGCGTLPNGRLWGQDTTLSPGWKRVGHAALEAALAPETWVPAAGALVFQVENIDRKLADWAADHTPVFGSQKGAARASDALQDATRLAYGITALATPSGKQFEAWAKAKGGGLAVGATAMGLTAGVTATLKAGTHRTRPDASDSLSFPSSHASHTAVLETLAARNLESLALPAGGRIALRIGLTTLTAGTAWSRVEAHKHFPSDVLAGVALGHFLGAFINDAFLGLNRTQAGGFTIQPSRKGVMLGLYWSF